MSFYKSINTSATMESRERHNYGNRIVPSTTRLGATTTGNQTVAPKGNVSTVSTTTKSIATNPPTNKQSARSARRQRSRQAKSNSCIVSDEEFAKWEEEQDRMDDLEDRYLDYHSRTSDSAWAAQSSMAAFDHFVKTGVQLENREFMGRQAGAMLKSEYSTHCDDGDYHCDY